MDEFHSIAEQKILQAMREGAFDNLRCKGQPLDLSEDPFEPPELRMGHHLLRVNGFAPCWIEESKDIELNLERMRDDLARIWCLKGSSPEAWRKASEEFRCEVEALNRRIVTFNLKAPSVQVHKPLVDWEAELERAAKIGK